MVIERFNAVDRLSYKDAARSPWDEILEKIDGLERDAARIGALVTCLSSEMEQALNALGQVRDDLNKTKKTGRHAQSTVAT